ncbi:hypothetical protein BFV94_4551 [Alteromonas macleodii]|uniref:Uncharacterized protein n=1 Tax=Alteromonas macleodii TaxID=28108 RepID=A0AB36FRL9_ALTMA|nr:hypothetical protein BFV93_4768 [Alteromonas macleodii]OES24802.1 hypothetical protein BFV95_4561 [Alteromonas macleodii]OES25080.1 hypothetical protein BFV94_4551 [Alteromonas macleodii]OES39123.1 hypothetical protein BFV96_4271 [Alteromonas macleodii]
MQHQQKHVECPQYFGARGDVFRFVENFNDRFGKHKQQDVGDEHGDVCSERHIEIKLEHIHASN